MPLLLYGTAGPNRPLALIFHGDGGTPGDYGYLAEALAERGFIVAAIDHQLPGDPPLPYSDNIVATRTPMWREAAASALFTMRELRAGGMTDPQAPVVLVGHSHGGDIVVRMATDHPQLVRAAFSLDHWRMPIPLRTQPRFCSIRARDSTADSGIVPNAAQARTHGIQITRATDVSHAAMNDGGSPAQHAQVVAALDRCLG